MMKQNGNHLQQGDYYLGLDVGTSSVGWAVTDAQYHLQKYKGKTMWGVRLFEEANPAKDRRTSRTARRRLARRRQRLEWLKMLFEQTGTRPEQDLSRLAVHSTKIYDPQDSFKNGAKDGEGELFIYTPHGMWYIINNSGKFSDKSLNNVKTPQGGAVGHRLMYDDLVDRLIRIYTEENEYSGESLY